MTGKTLFKRVFKNGKPTALMKSEEVEYHENDNVVHIPPCPVCGKYDNVHYSRSIDTGEDPIFVYDCGRCGNVFAYDVSSGKSCVITYINDDGCIAWILGRTICTTNSNKYSDIMNDNGLKTKDELLEFLANHYREGKTAQNVEKNSPSFMTIDEAKHHIQFGARADCSNFKKLLYAVTITYQPDVYGTAPTTIDLECSSFEELKRFWEEYIEVNNIYPECIIGFDIDLSMEDQNYINRLEEGMGRLLKEIRICSPYIPTAEIALDALLSSEPFKNIAKDIIFPHTELVQRGPNPEDVVKTVKRYYR